MCGWEVPVPNGGWRNAGIVTHAPGHYGLAWRILDAQYTRVPEFPRAIPQRRRRLFIIGHLDSWQYPAKVLFDGEMFGGHTPPRRTKGQSVAAGIESSTAPAKWWNGEDSAETLTCTSNNQLMPDKARLQCVIEDKPRQQESLVCLDMRQIEASGGEVSPTLISTDYKGGKAICYENHGSDSRIKEVDVSPVILGRAGTGGLNVPIVQTVYSFDSLASNSMKSANPVSGCREVDVAKTMDTGTPDPSKNQGGMAVVEQGECIGFIKNDAGGEQQGFWEDVFPTMRTQITPAVAIAENIIGRKVENGGNGVGAKEEVSYTLNCTGVHGVAYDEECVPLDLRNATRDPDKHDAVNRQGIGVGTDGDPMTTITASIVLGVSHHSTVRKLLPIECERLMTFPDNHTQIPWHGKPAEECPDAPRYKACGNAFCVNVALWIGYRIQMVENEIQGGLNESSRIGMPGMLPAVPEVAVGLPETQAEVPEDEKGFCGD